MFLTANRLSFTHTQTTNVKAPCPVVQRVRQSGPGQLSVCQAHVGTARGAAPYPERAYKRPGTCARTDAMVHVAKRSWERIPLQHYPRGCYAEHAWRASVGDKQGYCVHALQRDPGGRQRPHPPKLGVLLQKANHEVDTLRRP